MLSTFPEPDKELEAGDEADQVSALRRCSQVQAGMHRKPLPVPSWGNLAQRRDLRTREKQHAEQREKLPEEKMHVHSLRGEEGL